MAISKKELESILLSSFPKAIMTLEDTVGDQDHYSLTITDEVFNDLSIIHQHKLVKNALTDVLHHKLHSITIKTIPQK